MRGPITLTDVHNGHVEIDFHQRRYPLEVGDRTTGASELQQRQDFLRRRFRLGRRLQIHHPHRGHRSPGAGQRFGRVSAHSVAAGRCRMISLSNRGSTPAFPWKRDVPSWVRPARPHRRSCCALSVVKSASSNAESAIKSQEKALVSETSEGLRSWERELPILVPWSAMGVRAVFLVGFMASGKSTRGSGTGPATGVGFRGSGCPDRVRASGKAIPEIFRDHGEPGFRLAETSALRDLTRIARARHAWSRSAAEPSRKRRTVSCCGHWPSVFLDAPLDELWQRSLADGVERPLRRDRDQFARLHAERASLLPAGNHDCRNLGQRSGFHLRRD